MPRDTNEPTDLLRLTDDDFARFESLSRRPDEALDPRDRSARAIRVSGSNVGWVTASMSPADGLDVEAFRVRTVNLSRTGMSFLHGAPARPGDACEIVVLDACGAKRRIECRVVRCRVLEGRVHEVGVRFNEPIRLDDLVRQSTMRRAG